MADNWSGAPASFTTSEAVTAAKLNTEVRDRMDSLKAGLTDSSVDADIWQAIKSGNTAARSSVTHKVGRQYFDTTTLQTFTSDGTNWRHTGGPGPFDDFVRAAGDSITPSKSGHAWTEVAGDWDIIAGSSPPHNNVLAITGATTAIAALETGSLLDRPFQMHAGLITHTTLASIDVAVFVKFVDTSNYVYVQLTQSGLGVYKNIAASGNTLVTSQSFTPAAGAYHALSSRSQGQSVIADLNTATGFAVSVHARHDDLDHANLAAATKVGFRAINVAPAGTGFVSIAVNF